MRLALIYCTWSDWDLLRWSINHMRPLVDQIIVIGSRYSNYGELDKDFDSELNAGVLGCSFISIEPDLNLRPSDNETAKRNFGLNMAKKTNCTHFLMADSDEAYEPKPFLKEKERFLNPNLNGLVCGSQVYFKSPKLTIGLDTTRVTFIHKITPNLRFEFNRSFPFAFDKLAIMIDPTRQLNINSGVEWSDIICHHYSWIRKDYEKKIRNSTARANIERSTIREDLISAKEGYFCKFYGKTLSAATVYFNLPEFDVHEDLQQGEKPVETTRSRLSGNQ
jgi:hypothetical protein